jgi:hypothetical protein
VPADLLDVSKRPQPVGQDGFVERQCGGTGKSLYLVKSAVMRRNFGIARL